MRTLKLHFPDDALSTLDTLDTFLKQTKDARVFRRAQAVRNVVKGQRLQTVSDPSVSHLLHIRRSSLAVFEAPCSWAHMTTILSATYP
jgi:hypothetical protein